MIETICVAGAGTMGVGIAMVCAQHGFKTILCDVSPANIEKARIRLQENISHLVEKQKITAGAGKMVLDLIQFQTDVNQCQADFFIEAIIELPEAKTSLFNQLASFNSPEAIFASNTSSLSISALQKNILHPHRIAGMHFFNPAPVMKLVEVVSGDQTDDNTIGVIKELCLRLGKTPVICLDSPGFSVNRVARHYYLEAMKIAEDNIASPETIDAIMQATGFKMGPFKLMDLIGMDVNLAVSQSIYEAFDQAVRFRPSPMQVEKVKKGELGKKTGKGFYEF
jgi:3-hydroxybutyryl-CoA dehydrogenase